MPTQVIQVSSTRAFEATAPDAMTVTILNLGPDSIYYSTAATVSSGSNDGTLTLNSSMTFIPSKFFISAGTSRLQVTTQPLVFTEQGSLTLGESNMNRLYVTSNNITIPNQVLRLGYLTATKTEPITAVRMSSTGTAAGATPTLVRYGVYEVAANGDLTLIASTPNDTSIFSALNTSYQKTLSAAFLKTAGVRYAAGALVVTGAAAPSIASQSIAAGDLAFLPKLSAGISAQADLAASYTNAQAVVGTPVPYVALIP